jgi:hypothetical protein
VTCHEDSNDERAHEDQEPPRNEHQQSEVQSLSINYTSKRRVEEGGEPALKRRALSGPTSSTESTVEFVHDSQVFRRRGHSPPIGSRTMTRSKYNIHLRDAKYLLDKSLPLLRQGQGIVSYDSSLLLYVHH